MLRRHFLAASLATASLTGTRLAFAATTKLIVADQSELLRNLLAASGGADKLTIDLELPNFAGGPAILEAIRAGALDAAYVGDVPPIQARASGTLLPIIATFTREIAQYRLVSRPGLTIGKLADLKGKKVSYIEGSGRQAYLIEALNRAGLTLEDVEKIPLRVADLPDAIRSSAVDVAVLQEPHVTRLQKQIGATPVLDPEERRLLPQTSYIYARPEVLEDQAKVAALREFLPLFVQAGLWRNAHDAEWGKFYYTDFQGIAPEDTQAILASESPIIFQTSAEAIPHHQKLIDILYDAGELPERFDAAQSFSPLFDDLISTARV
ncbi:ABC transporter substrate-binding protein [Paracoccus sp. S3-43]|uniref:ABC transporter substrate-binding protein n=1 Tax=Paracoccus sp. S3-43 TaxID=3030011 RepID=UPI0023B18AEA|nr:ABC transporter substrate-binding protein [Paracoccus sp. S3-43]WEF24710.1 ABC transporter substrate-binding protein [Paracoccus sp. S3-43]